MAAINLVARAWQTIVVNLEELDGSYNDTTRTVKWYIKTTGNQPTSTTKVYGTQKLDSKITESDPFEFSGLDQDTRYYIFAHITNIAGISNGVWLNDDWTTREAEFTYSDVTSDSVTIYLESNYKSIYYYVSVYDEDREYYVYKKLEVDYKALDHREGYVIDGLTPGTNYTIEMQYQHYEEDYGFTGDLVYLDNTINITTEPLASKITTKVFLESASGTYSSSPSYTYTIDAWVGDTYDIPTFASTVRTQYLKDSLSSNKTLYNNLSFNYFKDSHGNEYKTGSFDVMGQSGTCSLYYKRTRYYLTLDADTGIDDFTVNSEYFDSGNELEYVYGQSVKVTANLLNNYHFVEWTTDPIISNVDGKTSNPISFSMPDDDFTLTANIERQVTKYNVQVYCYYELADSVGYEGGYEETLSIAEGTYIDFDDYYPDYELTGFQYKEGRNENGTVVEGVTVNKNMSIEFYYTRIRYNLTLKNTDGGINYFYANEEYKNVGSILEYKYGQSVTIEAVCKGKYTFNSWSSDYYTGLSGNPITIIIPNKSISITAITEQSTLIDEWEWTENELDAFANRGPFNTLTAARWNEFLDWCNEVIEYVGGTTISSTYYGTKDEPLYASDFNIITKRLGNVASGIATEVKATKEPGDIIYGWYFTNLSEAMNDLL